MRIVFLLMLSVILLHAPFNAHARRMKTTDHAAATAPESDEENVAHAEGRGVDINEVNRIPIRFATDLTAPREKREEVLKRLRELEASARANPEVELFLSPIGGFVRDTATKQIVREATRQEMEAHRAHIHMTIMR